MAAALIAYSYVREHARLVRDSIATARALTSALDLELAGVQSALFALATSPHLTANDLKAFHDQAIDALPHTIATNIILVDANGQQQLNTLRSYGEPLPANTPLQIRRIFETGRPVISDLFVGPVTGKPVLATGVPVRRGDSIVYSLNTGIEPERLSGILTRQRLPSNWIAAIFDSSGTVVSRTHELHRFVGKKGALPLVKRMREVAEDSLETRTLEGIPVLTVFSRSAVSDWTVAIGIPLADLDRELWGLLGWFILGLALLFLGSTALAWAIGGRIARSVRGLSVPALALGAGEAVTVPPLFLKEADDVGRALAKASEMLQEARHRAHHDVLTGLGNRALFSDLADHQLAICRRTGAPLAVLYIDLDGFKAVNDTHGHAVGDALLCAAAARLKQGIRASDIAARLGGDEFAVLLVDTSEKAAEPVAHKLAEDLSRPYTIDALTVSISASIGTAGFPDSGTTSAALLSNADATMYRAKSARKEQFATSG